MTIAPFNDGLGNRLYSMTLIDADPAILDLVGAFYADLKRQPVTPPDADPVGNFPPPCDGDNRFGQEATQSGQALAHAQHEAAIDGDECTAGACLLTRGSD